MIDRHGSVERVWSRVPAVASWLLGIALGVVAMIAGLAILGADPVSVLQLIAGSVIGSPPQQVDALIQAVPIGLLSLGYCFCFRAGFWNIGGEAYFYVGALTAAAIGLRSAGLPAAAALILMALGGATAGALLSVSAGLLKAYRGANEVVVTLMMNLAVPQMIAFAVRGPLADPVSRLGFSARLPTGAWLPSLLLPRLHVGVVVVLVALAGASYLLGRSKLGDRIRLLGANEDAAKAGGIPVARTLVTVSLFLGVLGGLAGMIQVAGVTHRVYVGLSSAPGFGYLAIVAALWGGGRPVGALLATLFYTFLSAASDALQVQFGIQHAFVSAVFVLALVAVLATNTLSQRARPSVR